MRRMPRRQSMLGTEAWDIAVSMDFRCFSNARVHAPEQWLPLPKLQGPEEGCAATFDARERLFSRLSSACIAVAGNFRISRSFALPPPPGVHPKSETGKLRTVSRAERN